VSASPPDRVAISPPAKLNLGLEVLRRRGDSYHDIVTIFLAIDVVDHLCLVTRDDLSLSCNDSTLAGEENLVLQALHTLRAEAGIQAGAHAVLHKSIPTAAGLGGASSDAAGALLAARALWRLSTPDIALHRIAADLGSDVPFFLRGGCALGRGRGDMLEPLRVPDKLWFVIVAPVITIPRKPATLYANLGPEDFSDGEQVVAQAQRLAAGLAPDPTLLGNAFARPLYEIAPKLAAFPAIMRKAGAATVAVSGAGPAHYAPFLDRAAAAAVANQLQAELTTSAQVLLARPAVERPTPSQSL
jgi:4-diphosphocytidyl-2-C-methyl-D-erythritol kinase